MSEVTTTNNSVLASFIERAARDTEFDVQKFGELLRMQREVEHDQARKAFNRAMSAAQKEMFPVTRDAVNKHLNNKYAKLETIDAAIRPIYTDHGFSVRFGSAPAPREGDIRIACTVAHDAGYFEENYLDAPLSMLGSQGGKMAITGVQAVGSAVTYLRRYLLTMVFNVVLADDEDDDGEGLRGTVSTQTYNNKPRPAQKSAAATSGNGGSAHWTDDQWTAWLEKVNAGVRVVRHSAEVDEIAKRPTVADKYADITTPPWVIRELDVILAEGHARFVKPGHPMAPEELRPAAQSGAFSDIDNAPENDPANHPDGGPRIAGESLVGAG